ncbi:MrpF/PhaF family protein [Streptomyces sp. NPDC050560]|uniref:MrpF/PhaF family protein n=1 Tax=Streptomyces sp. NPDC050560 TaxID=3365630 RepID=UPI00379BA4F8
MNGWLAAAFAALAVGGTAGVWGVASGPLHRRVLAQNVATSLLCLAVLLLAQGYARPAYLDVGLVLAVLGPVGTLVFARLFAADLRRDPPHAAPLTAATVAAAAAVTIALAVAAPPGRATVKPLVAGALLIAGNAVASRALTTAEASGGGRG